MKSPQHCHPRACEARTETRSLRRSAKGNLSYFFFDSAEMPDQVGHDSMKDSAEIPDQVGYDFLFFWILRLWLLNDDEASRVAKPKTITSHPYFLQARPERMQKIPGIFELN